MHVRLITGNWLREYFAAVFLRTEATKCAALAVWQQKEKNFECFFQSLPSLIFQSQAFRYYILVIKRALVQFRSLLRANSICTCSWLWKNNYHFQSDSETISRQEEAVEEVFFTLIKMWRLQILTWVPRFWKLESIVVKKQAEIFSTNRNPSLDYLIIQLRSSQDFQKHCNGLRQQLQHPSFSSPTITFCYSTNSCRSA